MTYYWAASGEDDVEYWGRVRSQIHSASSLDNAIKAARKFMVTSPLDYIVIAKTNDPVKMVQRKYVTGFIDSMSFREGNRFITKYIWNPVSGKRYIINADGSRTPLNR